MNLGTRLRNALAAITGQLTPEVQANTQAIVENAEADAQFRAEATATLVALGVLTTQLRTEVDALQTRVEEGQAIDPAEFERIKGMIDSLDEAFPDETQAPVEDDEIEEPIVDAPAPGDEEPTDEPTATEG